MRNRPNPKTMTPADFEYAVFAELRESFESHMAKGAEVCPLTDLIDYVIEAEKDYGIELCPNSVVKAYWEACDGLIDGLVQNEYSTPLSARYEGYSEDDRTEAVSRWESMRPSNIRRKAYLKRFGGA